MEFITTSSSTKPQSLEKLINEDQGKFMYIEPIEEDITIEEFEKLALSRLSVLKELESYKLRHAGASDSELMIQVSKLMLTYKLKDPRDDRLSHSILRLVYCRTLELRKWFMSLEVEVFRLRMQSYSRREVEAILATHAPEYIPLSPGESAEIESDMRALYFSTNDKVSAAEASRTFYKVPWTEVLDLVSTRRVILRSGMAYLSSTAVLPLLVNKFRLRLSRAMAESARRWRQVSGEEDEQQRLVPMVKGLSERSLGLACDYQSAASTFANDVTPATIPTLSAKHFPPCMWRLTTALQQDHHLRHGGRQQLSLFLKAVGLPLEDALMFWRTQFAPKMAADRFDRELAYNIRHNYGREGKRTSYSAHTCVSIIGMGGGAGDYHGCPFRRLDESSLRAAINRQLNQADSFIAAAAAASASSFSISSSSSSSSSSSPSKSNNNYNSSPISHAPGHPASVSINSALSSNRAALVETAVRQAKAGHYQLACACVFEAGRKAAPDIGISQPLQFYTESRRLEAERFVEPGGGMEIGSTDPKTPGREKRPREEMGGGGGPGAIGSPLSRRPATPPRSPSTFGLPGGGGKGGEGGK